MRRLFHCITCIALSGFFWPAPDQEAKQIMPEAAGSLDPTFGTGGLVITDFGGDDSATSVAIQADGKIVVAGAEFTAGKARFALARYNRDGTLDLGFGPEHNGRTTADLGGDFAQANCMALQKDGKIVVAGKVE